MFTDFNLIRRIRFLRQTRRRLGRIKGLKLKLLAFSLNTLSRKIIIPVIIMHAEKFTLFKVFNR